LVSDPEIVGLEKKHGGKEKEPIDEKAAREGIESAKSLFETLFVRESREGGTL